MQEQHVIRDVRQLKALSHAARVRILGAVIEKPMTAKQLADLFGEEPAKTSYHVKQLVKVGLATLVFTRETQNGIVEKYYQAIAREFQTDPYLAQSPEHSGNLESGFVRALSRAQSEFLRAYRVERDRASGATGADSTWGLDSISSDPERVQAFQQELKALVLRYAPESAELPFTFHYLLFPSRKES